MTLRVYNVRALGCLGFRGLVYLISASGVEEI